MAAQTQAEVDLLIDNIIIDNTTNQVSPAKVRAVLHAINARVPIGDPSAATFVEPLFYDAGTNQLSVQYANVSQDGVITAANWRKFMYPLAFLSLEIIGKGSADGTTPNQNWNVIEIGDIVRGMPFYGIWWDSAVYNGGTGGVSNIDNFTMLVGTQFA